MRKSMINHQTYEKYPKVGTYGTIENMAQKKSDSKILNFSEEKVFFPIYAKIDDFRKPPFSKFLS